MRVMGRLGVSFVSSTQWWSFVVYVALGLLLFASRPMPVQAVLPGFASTTMLATGFPPIRLRFLPDGRLAFLEREQGRFYVASLSILPLRPQLLFALPDVDGTGELGALSFAVDPAFSTTGYIYFYFMTVADQAFRVSRFTITAQNILATESIIWRDPDTMATSAYPFHFGGDLAFGPDGSLYLSQGEKSPNDDADIDKSTTAMACVHRFNKDGSVPNNYVAGKTGIPSAYAQGIRNGFRATWDFSSNRYFVGSVGGNDQDVAVESVYLIQQGAHYGWPHCEGPCDNPDFSSTCTCSKHSSPIFWYNHKDRPDLTGANAAVVLGFVYRGSQFPSTTYGGVLFVADWARGWIKYLNFDSNGRVAGTPTAYESTNQAVTFETNAPGIVSLEQGPDGALFYSSMNGIYRISYTGSTTLPPPPPMPTCTQRGCVLVALDACKCDAQCVGFNDCCSDYQPKCTQPISTIPPAAVTLSSYPGPRVINISWAMSLNPINVFAFVGDTIRWVFADAAPHTVTGGTSMTSLDTDGPASALLFPPATYSWVVPSARVFEFFCQVHPSMRGSINASAPPTTPSTTGAGFPTSAITPTSEEYETEPYSESSEQATPTSEAQGTVTTTPLRCAVKGCVYVPDDACQCDAICVDHGDCCEDYADRCRNTTDTPTETTTTTTTTTTTSTTAAAPTTAPQGSTLSDRSTTTTTTTTSTATTTTRPFTTSTRRVSTTTTLRKTCASAGCKFNKTHACQCDTLCLKYGDCCVDYATSICSASTTPKLPTCAKKGCVYRKGDACQCDAKCGKFGDCCIDYHPICVATTTTTPTTRTRTTTTRRTTTRRTTTTKKGQTTKTTKRVTTTKKLPTTKKKTTCAKQGCVFRKGSSCQCDKFCMKYKDCCIDYLPYCRPFKKN